MFKDYLASSKQHIEQWLGEVLSSPNQEFKPLYESMSYSLMQGGKRIRPILSIAVLEMLHKDPADYKEFLCAMECIHTYSLVHDDLPAMDNDDYRRGNLTNHKVYGEGMAILAGDGLLTYAFQLMTTNTTATPQQKIEAIQCVATAAGPEGMVGGQAFDMLSGFHGITTGLHEVKSGDALRIGSHEFSFLMAPMVHWPEVMFTYEQSNRLLFSADAVILTAGTFLSGLMHFGDLHITGGPPPGLDTAGLPGSTGEPVAASAPAPRGLAAPASFRPSRLPTYPAPSVLSARVRMPCVLPGQSNG